MNRKIWLVDTNKEICDAWKIAFKDHDEVTVFNKDFTTISATLTTTGPKVMVAAGNSFGNMGGGIDKAIAMYFPGIEAWVRRLIYHKWQGELNVGAAITIGLDFSPHKDWMALIYAPTMRAPFSINGTEDVYLATKAALQQFSLILNKHAVLVIPGLGGGTGKMCPIALARQMELAYRNYKTKPNVTTTKEMHLMQAAVQKVVHCE